MCLVSHRSMPARTDHPTTLEELQNAASPILFECIAGSRAYGTMVAGSDEDVRGIFAVPGRGYLDLTQPATQLADPTGNTVQGSLPARDAATTSLRDAPCSLSNVKA